MRALAYGALNPDIIHVVDRLPGAGDDIRSRHWRLTYGGKAANIAVALATWGIETALTGLVIGSDPLGDSLLAVLDRAFLDLSLLERDRDEPTRHCLIIRTPDGDRTIVCTGYRDARWQRLPAEVWADCRILALDGLSGKAAAEVATSARERGIPVVWLDAPAELVGLADLVVWSRHEHSQEEAEEASRRAKGVALTAGPGPIRAWWEGHYYEFIPPQVMVVDGTGAGDVFAAACARGIDLGWDPGQILGWAAAAGAALAARGREAGMPEVEAVERLMGG